MSREENEIKRLNKEVLELRAQIEGLKEELTQKSWERQDRWWEVLENMFEGCQIIGFDWRYLYINESVAGHAQLPREDLLGKTMMEVFPGIVDTRVFKELRRCMEKHTPHVMENKFIYLDGTSRWFELRIQPVSEGLIIFSEDISQKKRDQEILNENEEKLRLFTEHAPASLAMFDKEMCYLAVSDRWLKSYGLEGQNIIGRSHYEIFPESADEWKQFHQRGLAGEAFTVDEDKIILEDGTLLWLHWEIYPWYAMDDKVGGIVIFTEDITRRKIAEDRFRESQRKLSTLMNNLPGLAYRCKNDQDWTMEFVSEGCFPLTGYHVEDMIENKNIAFADIIHPEDLDQVWKNIQIALEEKSHFQLIYRIYTAENQMKWVWEQGQGVLDENGEVIALEGFITDITQAKMAEEALIRSEDLLNRTGEVAKVGGWDVDLETNFVVWTETTKMIHEVPLDYLPTVEMALQFYTPESQELLTQRLQEAIELGKSYDLELEMITAKGNHLKVRAIGNPIFDQGKCVHLSGTIQDITAQKEAEEALRESEEKYRLLFENAGMGIAYYSLDGRVLEYNKIAEENVGLRTEEVEGKSLIELFDEEYGSLYYNRLKDVVKTRETVIYEDFVEIPTGERWFSSSYTVITDAAGNPTGVQIISNDITEQKLAALSLKANEQQLRSLSQQLLTLQEDERKRLAQDLHDEAGQAISVLKIYLNLLSKKVDGKYSELQPDIDKLSEAINTAHDDIRELAFSLRPSTLDSLGLGAAVEKLCQLISENSKVNISVQIGETPALSDQAGIALYRITQEALNNVIMHGKAENVWVQLQFEAQDGRICLSIRDDGIGFVPILLQDVKSGLGILGMRERMDSIGGDFQITSEPRKGTTILACYPLPK